MTFAPPPELAAPALRARLALVADSHLRLTGRALVAAGGDVALALWEAPVAIVAHGIEDDPRFFFGNRVALARFEMGWGEFVGMPSRLSAEPVARAERDALLARVRREGFIDDYSGVRVSARGRRFRIERATVWELADETGAVHGQAAAFGSRAPRVSRR